MTKASFDSNALFSLIMIAIPAIILGPIFILKTARKWYGDFGNAKTLKNFAWEFAPFQTIFLLNIASFSSYFLVTVLNMILVSIIVAYKLLKVGPFADEVKGEKIMTALYHGIGFICLASAVFKSMDKI